MKFDDIEFDEESILQSLRDVGMEITDSTDGKTHFLTKMVMK